MGEVGDSPLLRLCRVGTVVVMVASFASVHTYVSSITPCCLLTYACVYLEKLARR